MSSWKTGVSDVNEEDSVLGGIGQAQSLKAAQETAELEIIQFLVLKVHISTQITKIGEGW